jgi:hypothetical protein
VIQEPQALPVHLAFNGGHGIHHLVCNIVYQWALICSATRRCMSWSDSDSSFRLQQYFMCKFVAMGL